MTSVKMCDSEDNVKNENGTDTLEKSKTTANQSEISDGCKVVHIALIPPQVRDEELALIALAFGTIKLLLYIRKRRHALVCFDDANDAEKMISFFRKHPAELYGTKLSVEQSNHKDLTFPTMTRSVIRTQEALTEAKELRRIACEGIPGSVVRIVSVSHHPIFMDVLYKVLENDIMACFSNKFTFNIARESVLKVTYNNSRTRDFTNPNLLAAPDMKFDSSIDLSAGFRFQEMAAFNYGNSDNERRRPIDDMESNFMAKRRRSDINPLNIDLYEPFEDQQNILFENRISPRFGNIKDDIIDQLLLLAGRNPQLSLSALIESINPGRVDNQTFSLIKQMLAERAVNSLSNARFLSSLLQNESQQMGSYQSLEKLKADEPFNRIHCDDMHYDNSEFNECPGCVLLVSNLNMDRVTPDTLFILFGVYGDVQRVRLLYKKVGSALVQLNTIDQAQQAIQYLNNVSIYGKRMRIIFSKYDHVQVSRDLNNQNHKEQWSKSYENSELHRYKNPTSRNCKNIYPPSAFLHLSNISDETTADELKMMFEQYGTLLNIKFFYSDRKMAIVEMENLSIACEALIGLHNVVLKCGKRLRISFAKHKKSLS